MFSSFFGGSSRILPKAAEIAARPASAASSQTGAQVAAEADRARDQGQFGLAATLYAEALRFLPDRIDLRVQLGNMLKDTGQLPAARDAYEEARRALQARLATASADEARRLQEQIADLFVQFGHLFKKAGLRNDAIALYRKAYEYVPRREYIDEIKIAENTVNGVVTKVIPLLPLDLKPSPATGLSDEAETEAEIEDAEDLNGSPLLLRTPASMIAETRRCVCGGRQFTPVGRIGAAGAARCDACGTEASDLGFAAELHGLERIVQPVAVNAEILAALLRAFDAATPGTRVALVGASLSPQTGGAPDPSLLISAVSLSNRRLAPGCRRCSFDAAVVWSLSHGVTQIGRVIDEAFQLLRPNGVLILGFEPPPGASPDPDLFRLLPSPAVDPPSPPLWRLEPAALLSVCEPMKREALFLGGVQAGGRLFAAFRKSGALSVGVMSGIGDAVWSFVMSKAVQKRYQADRVVYYVHDSGDARRKRSNNMLARFRFVSDLVGATFPIHADPALDPVTGHLNYVSTGPTLVGSADPFDYRLIANTYLEHGLGYEEIFNLLQLDPQLIDYDFFRDYDEHKRDMNAVEKVTALSGDDYVIFYYGALIDNTDGGLNRDGLWSIADWNRLGRLIHERYGCRIVVIGAAYDLDYARKVQAANEDRFYVNTIGQLDITETLALIQRCRFMISFPAGVGIVGPYMRVPTAIFWRPKHLSYHIMHDRAGFEPGFATAWAPPEVLAQGLYHPLWYGVDTPETAFAAIEERRWWDRPVRAPIGTW